MPDSVWPECAALNALSCSVVVAAAYAFWTSSSFCRDIYSHAPLPKIATSTATHSTVTTVRFFFQKTCIFSSNVTALFASTATRLRSSPAGLGVEGVAGVLMQTGLDALEPVTRANADAPVNAGNGAVA